MGAKITGIGTGRLEIQGVNRLYPCEYTIIPDRIVAGTFIIASLMFDGKIKVKGVVREHIENFMLKLEEMGAKFDITDDILTTNSCLKDLVPIRVITSPHPGFPTDLQSPIMTLMSLINGTSELKETVFENRFMHVPELNRMGTKISTQGNIAHIDGVDKLSSAEVMASDLRAGASLVLAGLFADGETIVNRIYHIDRGYENLDKKLQSLGADIKRIKAEL